MTQKRTNDNEKKSRLPSLLAWAFVLVSVGISGWFGWQGYQLEQTEQKLLSAIETQKKNLQELKQREKIGERMKAADLLNKAENYRTNWSEVYKDLNNAFTKTGQIKFNSVSVNSNNEVSVSAEADDILTAASFLLMVRRDDNFSNAFISNISPQGNAGDGLKYSFNATFDYNKSDIDSSDTK